MRKLIAYACLPAIRFHFVHSYADSLLPSIEFCECCLQMGASKPWGDQIPAKHNHPFQIQPQINRPICSNQTLLQQSHLLLRLEQLDTISLYDNEKRIKCQAHTLASESSDEIPNKMTFK
ncbi:hypothetical protein Drorol1_Dr00027188 [Drosera rotundifolia]